MQSGIKQINSFKNLKVLPSDTMSCDNIDATFSMNFEKSVCIGLMVILLN